MLDEGGGKGSGGKVEGDSDPEWAWPLTEGECREPLLRLVAEVLPEDELSESGKKVDFVYFFLFSRLRAEKALKACETVGPPGGSLRAVREGKKLLSGLVNTA